MSDLTKVIPSPGGQAVELPEGYRFDGTEVRISREGDRVVLEPADSPVDADTGLTVAALDRLLDEGMSGEDEAWDVNAMKQALHDRLASERAGR